MMGSLPSGRCLAPAKQAARPSRAGMLAVRCATGAGAQQRSTRQENRGSLRLYLDSASVYMWEKWAPKDIFFGVTSNPLILQQDKVPQCNMKVYKILAKQAFDLGYQEVQLQAWGRDQKELYATALDIADIDPRVAIKLPMTEAGANIGASLKRQGALVTMTAIHSSAQALAAQALGADYVAPYLGRMNDAGKQGFKQVLEMNDTAKGVGSSMRVLVASVRSASDVTQLATQGCDTFTLPPSVADELFQDPLTAAAAAEFESAARALGAY